MRRIRSGSTCWLSALPLLWLMSSTGLAAEEGQQDRLEALMDHSGLTEQLGHFEETVLVQLKEGAREASTPEAVEERIEEAVRSAYSARKLHQRFRGYLEGEFTADEIESVLEWLESPLGQRITRLEEDSSSPEGYRDQQEIAEFLVENLPVDRLNRYRQLDEAVRVSELGFTVGVNTVVAVAEGVALVAPGLESPDAEELRAVMEARREEMTENMRAATLRSFAYTYRDLQIAELDRYLGFAESPIGRKYHAILSAGYDAVLSAAARDLGLALGSSAKS